MNRDWRYRAAASTLTLCCLLRHMIDDAYTRTASVCFDVARDAVGRIDPIPNLPLRRRDAAEREIVCLLLHFLNRLLFDRDRASVNERMSALATAALRQYAQQARDNFVMGRIEAERASRPPGYGANNRVVTVEQYEYHLANLIREMNRDKLNSISADATNTFMDLYCDRQDEYGSLNDDWFRLLLVRFGKHFCEVVNADDDAMKIFFACHTEAVRMFDVLGDYIGDLAAAPAT